MIAHVLTQPLEEPPVQELELEVLHPPHHVLVDLVTSTSRAGHFVDGQLIFSWPALSGPLKNLVGGTLS